MKPETTVGISPALSVADYAKGLAQNGRRALAGKNGTYWIRYDRVAMRRIPFLYLDPPSPSEIRGVLWRAPAAVASYYLLPDSEHPANAWLYVCFDQDYSLDKLSSNMRRDIRKGLQELRVGRISPDELIAQGVTAVRDTQRRNGLEETTPEEFEQQIRLRAKFPGHVFWGAWKDEQLASYLSILEVEDWVEITSSFSADAFLKCMPNHALVFSAVSHYMATKRCKAMTFGSSSVQLESRKSGLHAFKTRVGFEVQPVHRAFVFHPLLRPFTNRLTRWGIERALRLAPGNLLLRRAEGVLESKVGNKQQLEPDKLEMDK